MSIFNRVCLPLVVGVAYTMSLVLASGVRPHWICGPVGLMTTLVPVLVFATALAIGMFSAPPAGAPPGAGDGGQADSFGADDDFGAEDDELADEQAARASPTTTQAAITFLNWPGRWLIVVLTMGVLSLTGEHHSA
jgi:hypothetical protein